MAAAFNLLRVEWESGVGKWSGKVEWERGVGAWSGRVEYESGSVGPASRAARWSCEANEGVVCGNQGMSLRHERLAQYSCRRRHRGAGQRGVCCRLQHMQAPRCVTGGSSDTDVRPNCLGRESSARADGSRLPGHSRRMLVAALSGGTTQPCACQWALRAPEASCVV